jgi:hypothetical protein
MNKNDKTVYWTVRKSCIVDDFAEVEFAIDALLASADAMEPPYNRINVSITLTFISDEQPAREVQEENIDDIPF